MNLQQQKRLIAFILFCINLLLSTTFLIYQSDWYVYLFILIAASLINAFSVLCITGFKMITNDNKNKDRIESKNYVYVVPCYNESEDELKQSLNSLTLQRTVTGDKRSLLILCDGIVKGKGNSLTTDAILKNILSIDELADFYDYKTWDDDRNIIKIHKGIYKYLNDMIDFILIIKDKNYGKRDSLVLARKMCYNYNEHNYNERNLNTLNEFAVSDSLFKYFYEMFKTIYDTNIDYIIGIDADTIFDYNCSYELIQAIEKDKDIHGCVGYVDILPANNKQKYSPYILYQYGEYMFSQCLRRLAQSNITKKVNCLSGCNQILRVSKETCGPHILNVLNYLPSEDENIFNHIRSYASEDRNHICHMLSMYPHVKSTQTLKAIAYTNVPTSMNVFLSQRRRWTLGATTNDMLLVQLPNINPFERIAAFVNVLIFCLTPFVFIATLMFLKAIITAPSMLMLYLSIIIFIPFLYALTIPVFIRPLSFRDSMYYYLSYLFFLGAGSFMKLITYGYSIYHMDSITWGRTRELAAASATNALIEIAAIEDDSEPPTPASSEAASSEAASSEAASSEAASSEAAIELEFPISTPTPSEIFTCDTVIACPPKEIMEEFISKYCITNMYELLPDASNNIYEINI
jgi:chitin synthase